MKRGRSGTGVEKGEGIGSHQSDGQSEAVAEPDLRFDEGLAGLEEIVRTLEAGDLPLEEALQAFESGVRLVRVLNEKLNQVERRVEILSRAPDGSLNIGIEDEEEA